jgi:hypothetical protein
VEQSTAIRTVYGQWFPYLLVIDPVWAAAHVETIFPREDDRLRWAAWDCYVVFNTVYDNVLDVLRPDYIAAIERTVAGDDDDEPREALVGHLISMYVRARTELDDELLGRFLAEAPIDTRAHLISLIGTDLSGETEISDDALARLRALFDSRLDAATATSGDALRELRGFSWWFASGRFDADWSLDQLEALLGAGGSVEFEHIVVERLTELAESRLDRVVTALDALIASTDDPWFVLGSRMEVSSILAAAAQSDQEAVRDTAQRTASRLIARGHPDFREVLGLDVSPG